jgi:hypothetical protein
MMIWSEEMDEPQEIWNDISECFAAVHFGSLTISISICDISD